MADIKVRVGQQNDIKVRVGQQNAIKVVSSISGAQIAFLGDIFDVNATNPENGSVLAYNTSTSKWDATLAPDKIRIDGGEF